MATADLTAQELREAFDYNPDTGEFTRLPRKNTRRTDRFGVTSRGTLNRKLGYYIIGLGSCNYLAHRLAWLHVTGSWPKNTVDHINGDRTDNRFCNLRDVSRLVNAHNTHKPNK